MGRMLGSDPDQLDGLGDTLTRAGDRLNAIGGEVSSLLAYAGWEGGDADDFRWQWHHQLTGILRATATESHEAARLLHRNAQEQRVASGDHGDLGGGHWSLGRGTTGTDGQPGFAMPWEWIEGVMLGGGLAALPPGLLNAADGGLFGADLKKLVKQLPDTFKKWSVDDVPGFTKGFAGFAGKLGPLQILSTGVDVYALVDHVRNGDPEHEVFNSAVNVAFDAALIGLAVGAVTVGGPAIGIAALAVGGAQLAFNIYTTFDAEGALNWTQDRIADVAHAVDQTAHAISDTAAAVGGAIAGTADAVGDVAGAVGGVLSGGLDAVGEFFAF
ncbi:hypothetical protein [Actinophytocola sp. KF-1]